MRVWGINNFRNVLLMIGFILPTSSNLKDVEPEQMKYLSFAGGGQSIQLLSDIVRACLIPSLLKGPGFLH